jgi:hypothetical protein
LPVASVVSIGGVRSATSNAVSVTVAATLCEAVGLRRAQIVVKDQRIVARLDIAVKSRYSRPQTNSTLRRS